MVPFETPSSCTMQITKIDPAGTQVAEFERVAIEITMREL